MRKHTLLGNRIILGMVSFVTALQPTFALSRSPASTGPSQLAEQEILSASSSGKLKLTKGRLIIDNDAAFEQKMAIINAAMESKKKGNNPSLYLSYYIYSDDYSSSKFNLALIAAAQAGIKVKLIVDLSTNYSRMDLFRFLESQGAGNLEVRLYNKPSKQIQEDAFYLTIGCSKENQLAKDKSKCEEEKKAIVAKGNFTPQQQLMQKLYLASYYTKNGTGLQVSTVGGQGLDVDNAQKQLAADKAKKDDFKSLSKSAKKAKDTGSLSAGLQAKSLLEDLAAEINPTMNLATGFLPTDSIQKEHKNDWDHISDYTHQKLILADLGNGKYMFELGGRNIEDSYHLKTKHLKELKGDEKQKYLFRDTDFYGEVASGGEEIKNAFLRNWNFTEMVASTSEMDEVAPTPLSIALSERNCAVKDKNDDKATQDAKFQQCVGQFFADLQANPGMLQEATVKRVQQIAQNTVARATKFATNYEAPTAKEGKHLISIRGLDKSDELSQNDLNSALITYVENLNTRKDVNPSKRTFGAVTGKELETGKYISHLWQRGMENACASGEKTQVILHSAYLMPSSSLLKTLGKMIDGTWNCHNVTIKVITNSFDTTDLNIINILVRGEMQALFDQYINGYNANSATLSYYEYTKPEGQTQSLHTKLSLFGNDIIDGSANADVRSYYMDANNGVYLHNVKELSADYQEYVDNLIRSGDIVESTSMYASYDAAQGWKLKNYMDDVLAMTEEFMNYWIGRSISSTPEEIKVKHAAAIGLAKKIIIGKAQAAHEASVAMLTPSKFQPEASDVRKECGSPSYSNNGYDTCVEKVKTEKQSEIDPAFNLEFEAF